MFCPLKRGRLKTTVSNVLKFSQEFQDYTEYDYEENEEINLR